jgi:hypothetical protein
VTLTNFRRAVAPEMTDTLERAHPKCLATKLTSSALAAPSTGEARRRATQLPDDSGSKALTDERGFARTVMTNASPIAEDLAGRLLMRALPNV